ncbi:hypothetical protein [Mycolicibacter hiberniae]|uniref:DUF7937 domain-containing protein n=1 Tax=Mycolicibacter hiberniae TaxID=29314 RepID=A0A7I7WYA5_9MYCO|nr:hypothetical protein [Mycolicibacter hiberniae]MCV7087082.1 hypothetical protein [Mycolicibacter hiberniae]ORV67907.1 hypothetical protein AWC09_17330 [Mycolicibacter hiberniae]BBZ21617.1 hypothetical protein MHIB_00350 [Mycolicibacter hiberniae]
MIAESTRAWNFGRDATAAALLITASALPWSVYLGVGIPDTTAWLAVALAVATVLAVAAIAATYAGPWAITREPADPAATAALRLLLATPYLLLVLGVVAADVLQTVRYGGSPRPPGGVGPGALLGTAGALLAAQPVLAGPVRLWRRTVRALGYASIAGATLSTLFNLYWRVRFALPDAQSADGFGREQVAIIATALVYGAVAWVTVLFASRWVLLRDKASQLSVVLLGAATVVSALLVWVLPVGRDIDGFHGIAQNTSTAGVGFEGYLVWVAAGALLAVAAARDASPTTWLAATRNTLLLIAVWSCGSALMRIVDLSVAAGLDLPRSPYDSVAMGAFDVVSAALAIWLRLNLGSRSLPAPAVWSVSAVLVGFTVARVVVGVGLAPRLTEAQRVAAAANPVYGNGLAQQITSTFDVVLCGLALCGLAVAIVVGRLTVPAHDRHKPGEPGAPRIFRSANSPTAAPTGGPKIYRGSDDAAEDGDVVQGSSSGD